MKASQISPDSSGKYCQRTSGVDVCVVPHHLTDRSAPERGVFAFAYNVTLKNNRPDRVQLLERHWIVRSAEKQTAEIVGPGVVGLEPLLETGTVFEYASSVVIHDAYGSMEGSYTFRSESGAYFEVLIPRFELFFPLVIH